MNIAFDAIALFGPLSKNRGIGNYAMGQFCAMIDQDEENRYFLINYVENTSIKDRLRHPERLTELYYYVGKDYCIADKSELNGFFGSLVCGFLKEYKIDLFYITSPFDGHFRPYRREWFQGVQVVATVYDIIPYVFKDHYLSDKGSLAWYEGCIATLRWVDRLLVISQSVKDDLISYLNFSPEKIQVIWGASNTIFQVLNLPHQEKQALLDKFSINRPFIMCTGGDDERKNIAGLIKAYAQLPYELRTSHQLVIVCKLSQESVERYQQLAEELGIKSELVLTNYVSDEDLVGLYNLCKFVAFVSIYEGFGLPVTEAWACGKAVLTSENSSLGQIAGDAAITVDPFSIEDIAKGLEKALTETDLSALAKQGQERLKLFQWDKVAENTLAVLSLLPQKKEREQVCKTLAFFTPLPPMRSGISDYSVDILHELAKYYNIDVFIDDGYTPTDCLPAGIKVYSHSSYRHRRHRYFDTVYQVGNSTYHTYMWEYLRRYGGTMVLHDYNLHGVVGAIRSMQGFDAYREILKQEFTPRELFLLMGPEGNQIPDPNVPVNAFLSNYAHKIIVHSNWAGERLLERDPSRWVRRIYHYAHQEDNMDKALVRQALGLKEDALLFASFGFVHSTKRIIPALKAFARLLPDFPYAQYIFAGSMDEALAPDFEKTVEELKLSDHVTVTGYTELDAFQQYMDASDICINLRWPYNGETSGSFMRLLAKGKCTLVSNLGSFGEIPDACCIKLPCAQERSEEQEIDDIYQALHALAENENLRKSYEEAARHFAQEELGIHQIVRQYANFIEEERNFSYTREDLDCLRLELHANAYTHEEIEALAETITVGRK